MYVIGDFANRLGGSGIRVIVGRSTAWPTCRSVRVSPLRAEISAETSSGTVVCDERIDDPANGNVVY